MPQKLFISHSNKDRALAAALAEAIGYLSLRTILCWIFSDNKAGNNWANDVQINLSTSQAMAVLITPNSINNRWINIEIGIAIAEKLPIIPICIGMREEDIPHPLNAYTCFLLNDHSSYVELFTKLFALFQIPFEEEMAAPTLNKIRTSFASVSFDTVGADPANKDLENVLQEIKDHLKDILNEIKGMSSG